MHKSKLKLKILKSFLWVGIFSVLGIVILLIGIFQPNFSRIELDKINEDKLRVEMALSREFSSLSQLTKDWAIWDDSYEFLTDSNLHYIESNTNETSLNTNQINAIVYLNKKHKLFYSLRSNETLNAELEIPKNLLFDSLWNENPTEAKAKIGYVKTEEHLWMISSYPILTSDGHGPMNGILLMAKIVDSKFLEQLKERTQLNFTPIYDFVKIEPPYVLNDSVFAQVRINDLDSNNVLTLNLYRKAEILIQGNNSLWLVILFLIGFLALSFLYLMHKIERIILNPLSKLKGVTEKIHLSQAYGERIHLFTNDELGDLAESFNTMMNSLEAHKGRLSELASKDELTGLCNRRAVLFHLEEELNRAHRYGFSVAILLFDLDHFKQVNDTLGHAKGDEVLKEISDMARDVFRDSDFLGRLGGDEFLIVFPHTSHDGAIEASERFRQSVNTFYKLKSENIYVSLSGGLANSTETNSVTDLIQIADDRLYKAKHLGRDKILDY